MYATPTGPTYEPPEAQSIRSMLHIVRILAIIFGILLFIAGIAYAAVVVWSYQVCNNAVGSVCNGFYAGSLGALLVAPIFIVIFGLVDLFVYTRMREIENQVNQRQYASAKSSTLIWAIIGLIFGGVLPGVLLFIAYFKFDALIGWQNMGYPGPAPMMGVQGYPVPAYAPPAYGAPPAYAAAPTAPVMTPAPTPAPPAPVAPPAVPNCTRCGKPTTFIPQYNRYYCYSCQQYV
jgi:hypothetical protein